MVLSSPTTPGTTAVPVPAAEPACAACPHPVVGHDAIGLRFCRATVDSGVPRGCVCRAR